MYGHQVIKSIENLLVQRKKFPEHYDDYFHSLKTGLNCIKKAQHFHFGNIFDVLKVMSNQAKGKLFSDKFLKLPYDICWFDCFVPESNSVVVSKNSQQKIGVLLVKFSGDIIWVLLFASINIHPYWELRPRIFIISLGKSIAQANGYTDCLHTFKIMPETGHYKTSVLSLNLLGQHVYTPEYEYIEQLELTSADLFLLLLSCKNITTETVRAKQPKGKKKNKKFFDYRILKYQPGKANKKYEGSESSDLESMPVHLCRGHFKTYTKDNPLFGRITGRYWWQPQLRGHIKNGIVEKEYNIKTDQNKPIPT